MIKIAYEIPQNLKYEEKIVFGLTLKQFAWIALFGILAAIVYLKTNLGFYPKAILALLLAGLGLGFAFLDLFGRLKILKNYYGSIRQAGYLNPALNGFIEVKEIEEDTVFLKDGSAKAIIQVVPIHFSLLSVEEQLAIVAAYRDFLNSLDFPVQIVMRTIKLSLNEYLAVLQKKVEKAKKRGLQEQFDSFKTFIQKVISEKKIKNRLFYLIIPVFAHRAPIQSFLSNPETDKKSLQDQLDIRVKVCQEKLKRCNLLNNRLNTQGLVSLSASFFEGFIEAQNEYFSTITTLKESEKNAKQTEKNWFNASGQRIERNNAGNR